MLHGLGHTLHSYRGENDGIDPAAGVAVIKDALGQIPPGAAQAKDDMPLVQAVGILGHGNVQNRVTFHPLTPPAVRPEVMYFWHRKKMIRTGTETVMAAAAKTGQLPLISVAWRAYSPAARV